MSTKKGFHMVDHGPFPIMEFKLNETRLSPEQLVSIAEQMRIKLLEFGCRVDVTRNSKATAA